MKMVLRTGASLDGAMNCGQKETDLIIIDFGKAFDKAPHMRLLHQLVACTPI